MGRTTEAIREWRRVLAGDPTRREARMYLGLVGDLAATTPSANGATGWSTLPLATRSAESEEQTSASAASDLAPWRLGASVE